MYDKIEKEKTRAVGEYLNVTDKEIEETALEDARTFLDIQGLTRTVKL